MKTTATQISAPAALCLLILLVAGTTGEPQHEILSNSLSAGESFVCPELLGDFEDEIQCDKYWRCIDGIATPLFCDDGLVFDVLKGDGREDPCDSPYVVDCNLRIKLQEPTFPSEFCPRLHGFFADPDPTICERFYTCKNGQHVITDCSSGLHFLESTGTCVWPDNSNREGCKAIVKATAGGFTCPGEQVINDQGMKIPHPSYPNLEDCQKFYVCLNAIKPQEASCNLGKVFNELNMLCDYPENVPECDGWYKNDPRFADYYYDTPTKQSDPGKVDIVG